MWMATLGVCFHVFNRLILLSFFPLFQEIYMIISILFDCFHYFLSTAGCFLWLTSCGPLNVLLALATSLLGIDEAQFILSFDASSVHACTCFCYCQELFFHHVHCLWTLSCSNATACQLQNTESESTSEHIPGRIPCSVAQLQ